MGLSHAEYGFVQIDAVLVDTAELELMHQVIVHLFTVDTGIELGGIERCDAVCQTFLHEVVAQIQVIFRAHGDGHVYRTLPIGIGQHFEHHQFALVQHALILQRNAHVFRYFAMERIWNHHARTLDGFLIQLDDDTIGRDVDPTSARAPSGGGYSSVHTDCHRIPWLLLPGSACRSL